MIPVSGADPRADAAAVTARRREAGHVIGLGAAFGPADRLADRVARAATGASSRARAGGRRRSPAGRHRPRDAARRPGPSGRRARIARARAVALVFVPLSDVPVVPTFEIIATVAQGSPGADGDYSGESTVDELRPWVEEAGRQGFYVVLDLQPGRADMLSQAKLYQPLLELPYVGLALDPEWALGPGQVPLEQIGGVDAADIDLVSVADRSRRGTVAEAAGAAPFRLSMIRRAGAADPRDHVAVLVHMDGRARSRQLGTWAAVTRAAPPGIPFGWKNFYEKDPHTMTPAETMAVRPTPLMISYQ